MTDKISDIIYTPVNSASKLRYQLILRRYMEHLVD